MNLVSLYKIKRDSVNEMIKKKKKEFERLAQGLLEYETLTGDELKELLKTGKIDRTAATSEKDKKSKAKTKIKSSVPSTGKDKQTNKGKKTFGSGPEPQPEG